MILPFKLYDRNSKRMIYPQDAQRMGIFIAPDGTPVQFKNGMIIRLQQIDVLHFSGFLDINKKPIWEGDLLDADVVIDFDGAQSRVKGRGVMAWDVGMGMFYVKLEEKGLVSGEMDVENLVIVGSIYG